MLHPQNTPTESTSYKDFDYSKPHHQEIFQGISHKIIVFLRSHPLRGHGFLNLACFYFSPTRIGVTEPAVLNQRYCISMTCILVIWEISPLSPKYEHDL